MAHGLLTGTEQGYYNGDSFGGYQFISLSDVIDNFTATYIGEGKLLEKTLRSDVSFHAHRALQELSFDTFKSCKSQEIEVPASLTMPLPRDYVNYVKLSWSDSSGIEHIIYPTSKTSNPTRHQADSNGEFLFDTNGNKILSGNLITNGGFHGGSNGWTLNTTNFAAGIGNPGNPQTTTTSPATATLGDPTQGYFYGFNGNAIGAYDIPQYWGIRQDNVPIVSGEKYTITYTLSGYTHGSWDFHIVDENGDSTATTSRTANGTYTETITASGANQNYTANSVFFRNNSTTNGNVVIDGISIVRVGDEESSATWGNYKSGTPSENQDDYQDDTYWPMDGQRYGLDPQYAQANGSYFIDCAEGKIHFSSNISGKTVILKYISDSLGTHEEMQVHKFAEEAVYKWIAYGCLSARADVQEYVINRYKKERFAETRKAKLRLSNLKLEEITQIFRGKSKQIKH